MSKRVNGHLQRIHVNIMLPRHLSKFHDFGQLPSHSQSTNWTVAPSRHQHLRKRAQKRIMNTIAEDSERIASTLDQTENRIKKSSKSKSTRKKKQSHSHKDADSINVKEDSKGKKHSHHHKDASSTDMKEDSKKKKHSRRHKDADSTDAKEDLKSHSSKKSKKKKKKKKKVKDKDPSVIPSPTRCDLVDDGSFLEDSQKDLILKAEVSLPSRRQIMAGVSMSDGSSSGFSSSDDVATNEKEKCAVSSSRSSNLQNSSRTRSSRPESGDASNKPRPKTRISRHKKEFINALTPIEGDYLTVQRKPATKSRQAEVPPKPTSRNELYEVSPKHERRKSNESSGGDPHEVQGSGSLSMSDADELLKKEIRAQIGQSLSQPGAVPVSSRASQHEKSKGKVDFKPTIAHIGTEPSPSSSAGSQLEELLARRKPLAPKKTKNDEDDEDRHKRELMRELTPTDYRTVTRTRASIPKPAPEEEQSSLKHPLNVHFSNEDSTLPSTEESGSKDKSGGKKKARNPFSSVKKLGRRSKELRL